jgi:hypothetical protein
MSVFALMISAFCFSACASEKPVRNPYAGWNYAAEIIIDNPDPFPREKAFVDAELSVPSERAGHIPKDIRTVLKHGFDSLLAELPSQVYAIHSRAGLTAFRIAFFVDIPANAQQRVAVFYDNPVADPPDYASKSWSWKSFAGQLQVATALYEAVLDRGTAAITELKYLPANGRKISSPVPAGLCGLTLAAEKEGKCLVEEASVLPGNTAGDSLCLGPVFAAVSGKRFIAFNPADTVAQLVFSYSFYAEAPFYLIRSRITFLKPVLAFEVRNRSLSFSQSNFTHYLFRPVTPTLAVTETEEIGCVMIDSSHRAGSGEGFDLMAGMVPADAAWTGLMNMDDHFAVTIFNLGRHVSGNQYREALRARLFQGSALLCDAPVHMQNRGQCGLAVTIARGSSYETLDAVHFSAWDNGPWRGRIDGEGRALNRPLKISVYPKSTSLILNDTLFPPPTGCRANAYLRGVR